MSYKLLYREQFTNIISTNTGYSYEDCRVERNPPRDCNSYRDLSAYRSVDGTCNNLKNPTYGATKTKLNRLICMFFFQLF